jgi:hypothetical protein
MCGLKTNVHPSLFGCGSLMASPCLCSIHASPALYVIVATFTLAFIFCVTIVRYDQTQQLKSNPNGNIAASVMYSKEANCNEKNEQNGNKQASEVFIDVSDTSDSEDDYVSKADSNRPIEISIINTDQPNQHPPLFRPLSQAIPNMSPIGKCVGDSNIYQCLEILQTSINQSRAPDDVEMLDMLFSNIRIMYASNGNIPEVITYRLSCLLESIHEKTNRRLDSTGPSLCAFVCVSDLHSAAGSAFEVFMQNLWRHLVHLNVKRLSPKPKDRVFQQLWNRLKPTCSVVNVDKGSASNNSELLETGLAPENAQQVCNLAQI